jgi:hypothetical protein
MTMKKAVVLCVTWVLVSSLSAWGKNTEPALTLSKGARIGVVSLLDPAVTQYHAGNKIEDSFLKTHPVQWDVQALFMEAVSQRISQMGLEAVAIAPSQGLQRGRQEFFIDGSVAKGLSKACADEFTQMAGDNHLDAFIVLAPGLNDSAHAGGARRKELPDYLHGWGFVTKGWETDAKPSVFNMTQVLLVSGTGGTALLRGREWGGEFADTWSAYTRPADLKEVPEAELDTLRPILSGLIERQSGRVLDQITVVGAP